MSGDALASRTGPWADAHGWGYKSNQRKTSWQRRYFKLTPDGLELHWYHNDKEARAGVAAEKCVKIADTSSVAHGKPKMGRFARKPPTEFCITVSGGSRQLIMAFDNDTDMHSWSKWLALAQDQTHKGDAAFHSAAIDLVEEMTLSLSVYSCKDLPKMDVTGSSDPYFTVTLHEALAAGLRGQLVSALSEGRHNKIDASRGEDAVPNFPPRSHMAGALELLADREAWSTEPEFKSEVLKKTLDPQFDDLVKFKVPSAAVVVITVYDWDRMSSDDRIGALVLLPEWFMPPDEEAVAAATAAGEVPPLEDGRGRRGIGLVQEWPMELPLARPGAKGDVGFMMLGVVADGAPPPRRMSTFGASPAALNGPGAGTGAGVGAGAGAGAGSTGDDAGGTAAGESATVGSAALAFVDSGAKAGMSEEVSQFERESRAALKLQMAWRAHAARKRMQARRAEVDERKRRILEEAAATKMQCSWRVHAARRKVAALKAKRIAALEQMKAEQDAAIKLQSAARRHLARTRMAARRAEVEAELREKAASAEAAFAARLMGESRAIATSVEWLRVNEGVGGEEAVRMAHAAVTIQGAYRSKVARDEVKVAREAKMKELAEREAAEKAAAELLEREAEAKAARARAAMDAKLKDAEDEAKVHARALAVGAHMRRSSNAQDTRARVAELEANLAREEAVTKAATLIQRAYRHRLHARRVEERLIMEADQRLVSQMKGLAAQLAEAMKGEEAEAAAIAVERAAQREQLKPWADRCSASQESVHMLARMRFEYKREQKRLLPKLKPHLERRAELQERIAEVEAQMDKARDMHDDEVRRLKARGERRRAEEQRQRALWAKQQKINAQRRQKAEAARRKLWRRVDVKLPGAGRMRVKVLSRTDLEEDPTAPTPRVATWELVVRSTRVPSAAGIGLGMERVVVVERIGVDAIEQFDLTPLAGSGGGGGGGGGAAASADDDDTFVSSAPNALFAAAHGADKVRSDSLDAGSLGGAALLAESSTHSTNAAAIADAGVTPSCRVVAADGVTLANVADSYLARRLAKADTLTFEVPKPTKKKSPASMAMKNVTGGVSHSLGAATHTLRAYTEQKRAAAKATWLVYLAQAARILDNDPDIPCVLETIAPVADRGRGGAGKHGKIKYVEGAPVV